MSAGIQLFEIWLPAVGVLVGGCDFYNNPPYYIFNPSDELRMPPDVAANIGRRASFALKHFRWADEHATAPKPGIIYSKPNLEGVCVLSLAIEASELSSDAVIFTFNESSVRLPYPGDHCTTLLAALTALGDHAIEAGARRSGLAGAGPTNWDLRWRG